MIYFAYLRTMKCLSALCRCGSTMHRHRVITTKSNNCQYSHIMKKILFLGAAVCVALAFSSCKSNESAYRKAYEKAKAQDGTTTIATNDPTMGETPTVTPITPRTYEDNTTTTITDNNDNVSVRQEKVSVVNGSGLGAYSVVVGSFSMRANAEGMMNQLRNAGYQAQIAFDSSKQMYRVVASTHNTKDEAIASRDSMRSKYPNAWLLYNE